MGSRPLAELLGDFAIKIGVGGAPHFGHAAFGQLGDDAVVSDGMLRAHRGGSRRRITFRPDDAQTGRWNCVVPSRNSTAISVQYR